MYPAPGAAVAWPSPVRETSSRGTNSKASFLTVALLGRGRADVGSYSTALASKRSSVWGEPPHRRPRTPVGLSAGSRSAILRGAGRIFASSPVSAGGDLLA